MLTRRELFASGAALIAAPGGVKRERPWKQRADELLEKDGCYADFEAWREWFYGRLADPTLSFAEVDLGGCLEEIVLYSIMCELVS